MMTHFKNMFIRLLTVLIILATNTADAGTVSVGFKQYKEKIMAADTCVFEKFIFARGSAIPKTGSSNSVIYSKRKAKLNATQKLYDFVVEEISRSALKATYPASVSGQQINKVQKGFISSLNKNILEIKNMTEVYSEYNGKEAITVIGVPWENIEPYLIKDYSQLMSTWQEQLGTDNVNEDPYTYYNFCADEKLDSAFEAICTYMSRNFGNNAVKTVRHEPIPGVFKLWGKDDYINNLTLYELENLSLYQKLSLLEESPYNPLICYMIGNSFRQVGLNRTACLFYFAGSIFTIDHNSSLRNLLEAESCDSMSVSNNDFVKTVYNDVHSALDSTAIQVPSRSILIIKSLGTVPCSESTTISRLYYDGNRYFQQKDFKGALRNYLYALEERITSDLLNMIGITLIRLNQHKLAIPFLRQSLYLNPDHKYALVNLTESLFESNYKRIAIDSYQSALKNTNLDNWGITKLKKIKLKFID